MKTFFNLIESYEFKPSRSEEKRMDSPQKYISKECYIKPYVNYQSLCSIKKNGNHKS